MVTKKTITHRSIIWKIPLEEFKEVIKKSRFIGDILRHFGLRNIGGNPKTVKARILAENIDISHIQLSNKPFSKTEPWNKGLKINHPRLSKEECFKLVFIENSTYGYKTARRYVLKYNLIEYKCRDCGIGDKWNNKPITLELEHINGIRQNHNLSNLTWLCPNCHSQTPTFRAKNKKQPLMAP